MGRRKVDESAYHEAMDRCAIMERNAEDYLLNHHAVSKHKDIKAKVRKACDLLAQVYQDLGNESEKMVEQKQKTTQ